MDITLVTASSLRYDDGAPVRAASGITPFEDGWLVVSDDATHAALWTDDGISRIRVLPPVQGHDVFDEASGTKRHKPDFEAACRVPVDDQHAALLLGSGSLRARMRAVVVTEHLRHRAEADLGPLYERVAAALDVPLDALNLEGACIVSGALRWFQRGNTHLGIPSASVDVELDALLAVLGGRLRTDAVPFTAPQTYILHSDEVPGLAVTDALALPDGRVLLAAASEDTPNAYDDGPVGDTALILVDGTRVLASRRLEHGPDGAEKVEGLALAGMTGTTARIVAVVDADDPATPSRVLELDVDLP